MSRPLPQEKQIVLVRHGLTTWNEQKKIQVPTFVLSAFLPLFDIHVKIKPAMLVMHRLLDTIWALPANSTVAC